MTKEEGRTNVFLCPIADAVIKTQYAHMKRTYIIHNERLEVLDVWHEPWCHPYRVPSGSKLEFQYDASERQRYLVETIVTKEGITIWLDTDTEPEVVLDGVPVEPSWDQ